jgi:hypothetical protein
MIIREARRSKRAKFARWHKIESFVYKAGEKEMQEDGDVVCFYHRSLKLPVIAAMGSDQG